MRLFVKTESMLEAVGLVHSFPDYELYGTLPSDPIGVIFCNNIKKCCYVSNRFDPEYIFDRSTVSSVGLDGIKEILDGVVRVETIAGHVDIHPKDQVIHICTSTLSFLDLEKIYLTIQPNPTPNPDSSLVSKVVKFEYWKNSRDCSDRVVLVKEETEDRIRGLDVLDDFRFKSFSRHKMENFKVVQ